LALGPVSAQGCGLVFQNRQYDLSVDALEMENAQASSSLARNQEAEGDFAVIANQSESLTLGKHFSHRQLSMIGESLGEGGVIAYEEACRGGIHL
jgi:hypothetical protein